MYKPQTFVHTERVGGVNYCVPLEFTPNELAGEVSTGQAPPIVYFSGYGEGQTSTNSVLFAADSVGVPVVAAKMHFAELPTALGNTKEEAFVRAIRSTAPDFLEQHTKEYGSSNRTNVVSNSHGSTLIGLSIREAGHGQIASISSLNPLGLSIDRKSTVAENAARFLAKYLNALRKTSPFEKGALKATLDASLEIIKDVSAGNFSSQLRLANTTNVAPEYVAHARRTSCPVELYSGTKDTLLPADDIERSVTAEVTRQYATRYPNIIAPRLTRIEGLKHQDAGIITTTEVLGRIIQATHRGTSLILPDHK